MEKAYGISEAQNCIAQVGKRHILFFGCFEEDGRAYEYRHEFDHKPSASEVKEMIVAMVNADTEERIMKNHVWRGNKVWLSTENQMNFKAAYDLNAQTCGAMLPLTFKLGEDEEGQPMYHEFCTLDELSDFYSSCVMHVNACLVEGWAIKDSVNLSEIMR